MNYKIRTSTVYIEQLLSQMKGTIGRIHSVYRKTINISIGDSLIALQTMGSPVSPISLITKLNEEEMNHLGICAGDIVHFSDETIEIKGRDNCCRFSRSDSVIYDTHLTGTLLPPNVHRLAANIKSAVSSVDTGGFEIIFNKKINETTPLMLLAAKDRISHSFSLYIAGKYSESSTELARLIGLGIGLTPSGDDFLCGIMAGLQLAGASNHPFAHSLKEAVRLHLKDTVDVSAAFLKCALENQYSLAVNNLHGIPSAREIKDTFLKIGHSSGIDTLCGIWYAIQFGTGQNQFGTWHF